MLIIRTDRANNAINTPKYTHTERTVPSSADFEFIVILCVAFGCAASFISLRMDLKSISIRDTFIPPPVLPAQAPTNISITRIVFDNAGHISKSAVE